MSAVDTLDYGVNADVLYSIVGGNGSALFDVVATNGTVYVKQTLIGQNGQYKGVIVRATDQGNPPQSTTVSVTMLITQENRYAPTVREL